MFRNARHIPVGGVIFTLVALILVVFVSAVMVPAADARPRPVPTPTPVPSDFYFSLSYTTANWFDPSYMVRGDTSAFPGPHYWLCAMGGCFWSDNSLLIWPRTSNFSGTVNIEVLNLPPGITAEIPSSVFIPLFGRASIPFKLRASSAAALMNVSGVVLRGTSGGVVHTQQLPTFSIVDQLPNLTN